MGNVTNLGEKISQKFQGRQISEVKQLQGIE